MAWETFHTTGEAATYGGGQRPGPSRSLLRAGLLRVARRRVRLASPYSAL